MRAILMFHNCEGQSHKTTDHNCVRSMYSHRYNRIGWMGVKHQLTYLRPIKSAGGDQTIRFHIPATREVISSQRLCPLFCVKKLRYTARRQDSTRATTPSTANACVAFSKPGVGEMNFIFSSGKQTKNFNWESFCLSFLAGYPQRSKHIKG